METQENRIKMISRDTFFQQIFFYEKHG